MLVAAAPPKRAELGEKLDGMWVRVRSEEEGKSLPSDLVVTARKTIKGDHYTVKAGDETIVGTITSNTQAQPAAIDSTLTEGPA